jgi:hypothetical protein
MPHVVDAVAVCRELRVILAANATVQRRVVCSCFHGHVVERLLNEHYLARHHSVEIRRVRLLTC